MFILYSVFVNKNLYKCIYIFHIDSGIEVSKSNQSEMETLQIHNKHQLEAILNQHYVSIYILYCLPEHLNKYSWKHCIIHFYIFEASIFN